MLAPGVSTGSFPSSQEEEDGTVCERPFQLWQSSRAPLEPASPGGALASGLGVLWGCGEDAAGCGRDTHTSAGARARPPLLLPTSTGQGMGWIRAGSRSLAALGGLRHLQAQLCPCCLTQESFRMAGKVTEVFPRTRWARGCLPAPSRSSSFLPGTWHGALAQAVARGDRRPQLGCCCQPGRRGHAEPDGCSVPVPAPQGCPQGAGRCRSVSARAWWAVWG